MTDRTYTVEVPQDAKVYSPKPRIEICRNCHGSGCTDLSSLLRSRNGVCPVCNGSGRVIKTITLTIDVKPYEQKG